MTQAARATVTYLPTPLEKRVERYTSQGRDIYRALSNALVARELTALTDSRLPYPCDAKAELVVLGGMIWGAVREPLPPDLFFFVLHRELALALEGTGPTRDAQAICEAVCARTRNMTQDVVDLVFDLVDCEYSASEFERAAFRVSALADSRALLSELERLARLLRVDATSVEDVRPVLARLGRES